MDNNTIAHSGLGSVPVEEQETTINFCRSEAGMEVWTSDRTVMTKLDRLCSESPSSYQCREVGKDKTGTLLSKTYSVKDKRLLSFRTGRREYTEEQRAAMAERGRRLRASQFGE